LPEEREGGSEGGEKNENERLFFMDEVREPRRGKTAGRKETTHVRGTKRGKGGEERESRRKGGSLPIAFHPQYI
jgi:hypothetical protein